MRPFFADAQAALPFVIAQGRNLEAGIYARRYPTLNYAAVVPVVTEGNPWGIGTMFFTVDVAGEAKFISGAANDIPFSSVQRDMGTHDFAMVGAGWEWNLEEVNQAAMYNFPLNDTKANASSDNIERLLYNIAMHGTTEKGWTGFVNSPIIQRVDVDASGSGSSTFWANKTPQQILRDVNNGLRIVRRNSKEIEWADTVAMPPDAMSYLATEMIGGEGTLTILEYLRRNNAYTAETGQQLTFITVRDLATASQDGGGRMVFYRRDRDVLRFHLPMPKQTLQPRQKSLMGFEQGLIARTGGTEWRMPGAALYLDEVTAPPS